MSFLSNVLTGVSLGSIYAIIALGYTMVYGIAKMLNFAHGDIIMVGAFMCFFATGKYGLPPLVSVLLAMVVCTTLGIVIEGLAYRPLREAPSLAVLITAIGVSYLLQNGAQLLWGADTKTFTPIVSGALSLAGGRLNISYISLLAMACCLVVMVCLTLFTSRTRMGKAMRACSEDKGAAQLMGINVNATISTTFAIGSALAAVAGVLMRKDLLTEIVGEERANSNDPFTQSEYLDILRQFKEKYPTIDGKESIAVTLDAESKNYEGTLFGMYGMTTYYADENNNIMHKAKAPRYQDAIGFMNTLYTEGLLDKEWVVNKKEQWTQKLSAGNVFSTFCSYWDPDSANTSLASTVGEDAKFYSYKVVADGVDPSETKYSGRSTLGWDAIGITSNCQNPEAAIKFIDFLVSEEGQYLMMWGLEGEHWDMVDGKHVPKQEIVDGFKTDFDNTKLETGIRKWTWFIKNGNGTDGSPYDVTKYETTELTDFANASFGESDRWDTADFTGLEPAGSSPEGLKWQKVKDVYDQNFPKMVNAADSAEANAVYESMLAQMEEAGLSEVEAYMSGQYQDRLKLWGMAE